MQPLRRLRGMQNLSPPEYQRRESARLALSNFLALGGYQPVESPLLEETELFLRKSGGELVARMYSFADPGGNRVNLRPEFTTSVLGAYLESDPETPSSWAMSDLTGVPVVLDFGLT